VAERPFILGPRLAWLLGLFFSCLVVSPIYAQQPPTPSNPLGAGQISSGRDRSLTLLVSVRERSGIPLEVGATVRLASVLGGQSLLSMTQDVATATFPNVQGGEYEIEVEAVGYQTARERASIFGVSTYTVYVYLTPLSALSKTSQPSSGTVMTPDLQKEMDQGLQALKQKRYEEARKHLEKAAKKAPSNSDIQYMLGMIEYHLKNIPAARKHFETTLSLAPAHERALLVLAEIQMEAGENAAAVQSLETALQANTVNWQSHLLLAYAYPKVGEYEKARVEAARAAELNRDKAAVAGILQGKLFLMERKPEEARKVFEDVANKFPADPATKEAKDYLAKLNQRAVKAAEPEVLNLPLTRTTPVPERPWAPPDIDSNVPAVARDVSCSLSEVTSRTRDRLRVELTHFERFGATEHIEHQEIDSYGIPSSVKSHDFMYIVFVHRPSKDYYFLDERRDGAESLYSFPTSLATRGLVAMGVNLFHPVFSKDFEFTCDGLGQWRGHPAWQLRFEQKQDVPSRIRTWEAHGHIYPVPLKGRVWVAANTYDLLHLETELREPLQELDLKREHLIIDYGPVKFSHNSTELWLPWYAEMYFDLRGKRYHHRHTLTDYILFDVDMNSTIADPKKTEEK
jgi:Tfp pilus assembly protein PilF